MKDELTLPEYAGSLLRGQFGALDRLLLAVFALYHY